MTPSGPGVIKYVFGAGISRMLVANYAVSFPGQRVGVVFSEKVLRTLSHQEQQEDCAAGFVSAAGLSDG